MSAWESCAFCSRSAPADSGHVFYTDNGVDVSYAGGKLPSVRVLGAYLGDADQCSRRLVARVAASLARAHFLEDVVPKLASGGSHASL